MTLMCRRWILVLVVIISVVEVAYSGWTPWGPYSVCSRSCGEGVKFKERLCVLHEDGNHNSKCRGKNKMYKLCNTQACEGSVQDFRAAQCEEFNNRPLDGILYKWQPYYGHGESCELLCFASGFSFYHKLADKVQDGTRCSKDTTRICIQGKCKSVGCDKKIGSTKQMDGCGVCGGDNTSCMERDHVNGIYDISTLSRGYSTVTEIPVGATNITVSELGENRNLLVFWDSLGNSFAIDAVTRKQIVTHDLAGTLFSYSPLDYKNRAGMVKSPGPITSPLTVYLVNQGAANPGIEYSYSSLKLPRESIAKKANSIKQKALPPSNIQVSLSNVPSRTNGIAVSNIRIVDSLGRTPRRHSTKPEHAPKQPQYVYENKVQVFGPDSSIPERKKNFDEVESHGANSQDSSRYTEAYTLKGERSRPLENRQYNPEMTHLARSSERYVWSYGKWTPCSSNCGNAGFKRRAVTCVDRVERLSTEGKYCRREKRPDSVLQCNNRNCTMDSSNFYVRWQVGSWGPCSRSCDLGDQSQQVFCQAVMEDESTKVVDEKQCLRTYSSKPRYRRSCNEDLPCTSLVSPPMWTISAWTECSVTCGSGRQTRRVDCRDTSRTRSLVPSNLCSQDTKPISYKKCSRSACPVTQTTRPSKRGQACQNSYYGCCPDKVTPARGLNWKGCPQTTQHDNRPTRTHNDRNANTVLAKTGSSKILPCGIKPPLFGEYLIQWRKDGMQYPIFVQYSGHDSRISDSYKGRVRLVGDTSLQIGHLTHTDTGFYQCSFSMVDDYDGSRRRGYRLYLQVKDFHDGTSPG